MKVEEKPSRGINPYRGDWMNQKWSGGGRKEVHSNIACIDCVRASFVTQCHVQ